ncbi:MAG: NADH-quinone oxidoreductase subunit NuoK [Gemmataceae bacterium]
MAVTLHHFLVVGAALFALGLVGFLSRRNLIVMFLCAEMMLQGWRSTSSPSPAVPRQPARAGVRAVRHHRRRLRGGVRGALILMLYKRQGSLDVSLWQDLREADLDRTEDEEPLPPPPPAEQYPHLSPCRPGARPPRRREEPCLKPSMESSG